VVCRGGRGGLDRDPDGVVDLLVGPDSADEEKGGEDNGKKLLALGGLDLLDVDVRAQRSHRPPPARSTSNSKYAIYIAVVLSMSRAARFEDAPQV
jgi:hypothetical protein